MNKKCKCEQLVLLTDINHKLVFHIYM